MKVYSIIPRPAWNNGIWSEVVDDYATARRSFTGDLVVVEWDSADPTPAHLPDGAPLYYHPDDARGDLTGYAGSIFAALDAPEWSTQ